MKIAYLNEIRSNSCYPAFRKFADIATVLLFILAALIAIAGLFSGQGIGILVGSVGAAIVVLLAIVAKELSLMIVDIADATIEVAGRRLDGRGQQFVQSVVRSEPSEQVNRMRVPDLKQSEVMPAKDRKRPENATLSNNMYCLYLTEKFEIKENETLKKFWVRGADNIFNSLNDALNAAHEIELQEQSQANLDAEKRRIAIEEYGINLNSDGRFSIPTSECLRVLGQLGFNITEGSTKDSWEISKTTGSKRFFWSTDALSEFTFNQIKKSGDKS